MLTATAPNCRNLCRCGGELWGLGAFAVRSVSERESLPFLGLGILAALAVFAVLGFGAVVEVALDLVGGGLLELLFLGVYLADAGEFADFLVDVVEDFFLEVFEFFLCGALEFVGRLEEGLEFLGVEVDEGGQAAFAGGYDRFGDHLVAVDDALDFLGIDVLAR